MLAWLYAPIARAAGMKRVEERYNNNDNNNNEFHNLDVIFQELQLAESGDIFIWTSREHYLRAVSW